MEFAQVWRTFFQEWPQGLPPRGVVVTSGGEPIPFVGFLMHQNVLLLERRAPDAVGARKVIIPYGKIDCVKVVDPIKPEVFTAAGFTGTLTE